MNHKYLKDDIKRILNYCQNHNFDNIVLQYGQNYDGTRILQSRIKLIQKNNYSY